MGITYHLRLPRQLATNNLEARNHGWARQNTDNDCKEINFVASQYFATPISTPLARSTYPLPLGGEAASIHAFVQRWLYDGHGEQCQAHSPRRTALEVRIFLPVLGYLLCHLETRPSGENWQSSIGGRRVSEFRRRIVCTNFVDCHRCWIAKLTNRRPLERLEVHMGTPIS